MGLCAIPECYRSRRTMYDVAAAQRGRAFFIFWGTKAVRRRLGYLADYCPLCGELRCFKLKRVGMAGHIYGIALGEGQLVGHVMTCEACDVDLNGQPERYREIAPKKLPLPELAARTNPEWQRVHTARLAVEKQISSAFGKLSAQVRQALLEEPFALLAPKVEARFSVSQFDGPTALALVGMFVVGFVATAISEKLPESVGGYVALAGWIAGLGLVAWQLLEIKHRYFRDKIFPTLVPALRRLKPSAAEIEAVLKTMKSRGEKIGSKLDPKRLLEALQAPAQIAAAR